MKFYFHPDTTKGVKQGLIMETKEHKAVISSHLVKLSLLKPSIFDFTNHLTGKTEQHGIGATVEIGKQDNLHFGLRYVVESYFKYDGENVWDYLFRMGCTVERTIDGLKYNYTVYRRGLPIASIESAGGDLFNDDEAAQGGLKGKIGFRGQYRVECDEADAETAYLVCFALERTVN